jgi:hypothetical protein
MCERRGGLDMRRLLVRGTCRASVGALAVVCVLAGVTWAGGVATVRAAGGHAAAVPGLAGVWDVTFKMPPCVVGCGSRSGGGEIEEPGDTYTFTHSAGTSKSGNTYDIANGEGFHALGVVVSGGASTASANVCWTAPPVKNSDCPGGRSPGAGYGTQTMNFKFPSNGKWEITGDYQAFSPTGTPLPPVLPYVATPELGCSVSGARTDIAGLSRPFGWTAGSPGTSTTDFAGAPLGHAASPGLGGGYHRGYAFAGKHNRLVILWFPLCRKVEVTWLGQSYCVSSDVGHTWSEDFASLLDDSVPERITPDPGGVKFVLNKGDLSMSGDINDAEAKITADKPAATCQWLFHGKVPFIRTGTR